MRITFFSLCILLALTGCRAVWDPTFMPAGYAHQQKPYKGPPGPEAPDIGYEYTKIANEAAVEKWRVAVRDLLLKAKTQGLVMPRQVMLKTDLPDGVMQSTYDFVLREAVRDYGYTLWSEAANKKKKRKLFEKHEKGYVPAQALFYSVYDPDEAGDVTRQSSVGYNGDLDPDLKLQEFVEPQKGMDLVIGIVEEGRFLTIVRGRYDVPLYGYSPGVYFSGFKNPVKTNGRDVYPVPAKGLNP